MLLAFASVTTQAVNGSWALCSEVVSIVTSGKAKEDDVHRLAPWLVAHTDVGGTAVPALASVCFPGSCVSDWLWQCRVVPVGAMIVRCLLWRAL